MKRIALVTHSLSGGVWAVTLFLAEVLKRTGRYAPDNILIATSARDRASVRLLAPSTWRTGIKVQPDHHQSVPLCHVGAMFVEFEFQRYRTRTALTSLLNEYDLVQVVAGTPAWACATASVDRPVCLFTATTAKRERASLFRSGTVARRLWTRLMTAVTTRLDLRALKGVQCVFAESLYTRKLLADSVPPDRLFLGVPGVDASVFSPGQAYCGDGYILCVGRLDDPRKNLRLLLEAYSRLRMKSDAPRLVLVGNSGPRPADWEYAVSLGIAQFIEVHVGVPQTELVELYRGAALFVLPSDEEGLGVVLLEAMACGLPLISTDSGGPATAIVPNETGCLTPVRDVGALADTMANLLANPELRSRMGRAGRALAETRFSIAVAGKVYTDVYDQLLRP